VLYNRVQGVGVGNCFSVANYMYIYICILVPGLTASSLSRVAAVSISAAD